MVKMNTKTLIPSLAFVWVLATTCIVLAKEPIEPIIPVKEINLAQVELGRKLYFDRRLSKSGFLSCNSCHNLSMGGTDNLKTSVGHNWQQGLINAPTVLNSSMNFVQFWDGRAANLKEQAGGPITSQMEMAFTHTLVIDVLKSIPQYVTEFKLAFSTDSIKIDHVTQAIAEFEKTLVTPNSRFDQWLLGAIDAITEEELAGYQLFKQSGCIICHNGAAVGGSTFQKMGVIEPYKTKSPSEGVGAVTGKESDRFKFKVPTLRNVELTYPYFHDGEAETLTEAVGLMGRLQLGKELTQDENSRIVAFLKTLTGDQPSFPFPILPPSTDKTPQPKPFE
jgi:cytochrome c peroxidase